VSRRQPVFVIGIEGGDFIGNDLSWLEQVYEEGVRVFLPLHYSKNTVGSISLGWGGKVITESERTGLTSFGKEAIAAANRLRVLLDFSHADEKTLNVPLELSSVMSSHTGPRSLQDLPRYTSDDASKQLPTVKSSSGCGPSSVEEPASAT